MKVLLLDTVKPLGGEPVPAGTVVEARRAMDRHLEVVGHGWLPLNGWEYEIVDEDEEGDDGQAYLY